MIYAKVPEEIIEEEPQIVKVYCQLYLQYLRRGSGLNLSRFSRESGLSYTKCRRLLTIIKTQIGDTKK